MVEKFMDILMDVGVVRCKEEGKGTIATGKRVGE